MATLSYNPEIATAREMRIAAAYERAFAVTHSVGADDDLFSVWTADDHGTLARHAMERIVIAAARAQSARTGIFSQTVA